MGQEHFKLLRNGKRLRTVDQKYDVLWYYVIRMIGAKPIVASRKVKGTPFKKCFKREFKSFQTPGYLLFIWKAANYMRVRNLKTLTTLVSLIWQIHSKNLNLRIQQSTLVLEPMQIQIVYLSTSCVTYQFLECLINLRSKLKFMKQIICLSTLNQNISDFKFSNKFELQ